MKISIRYTFATLIIIFITMFVVSQALFNRGENETIIQNFSKNINPFWKIEKNNPKIFEEKFFVPISNNSENEIIVNGKITIFDNQNNQLKNISTSSEKTNKLIDYLEINPEKTAISAWESKNFEIIWHWIADKFIDIETGEPKIVFSSPIENIENIETPDIHFWQKPKIIEKNIDFKAKIEFENNENIEEKNISLKYSEIQTEANTGIIINLLLILALFSIFSKIISENKNLENYNSEKIKRFEKFVEDSLKVANSQKSRKTKNPKK